MSNETERASIKEHTMLHSFLQTATFVCGLIVLSIVGIGVYQVRQFLPLIGYVAIGAVALVPAIGLAWLVVALVKYILKVDYVEIGPSGTLIRWFNRVTEYHPLGLKEHRSSTTREKKEEAPAEIPSLLSLLKEGAFSTGELLLGYHLDGSARYGLWNDLRTFVIAGKSRSGKTVTATFFIIQALLNGAIVYVADPHYNKRSGLLKVLEPLIPFLKVAGKPEEIVQLVKHFAAEMRAREDGSSTMGLTPLILVIDEWTMLLRSLNPDDIDVLVNTVLNCAEAWAGFEGYAFLCGHEWTANESGGKKKAAIRRAFHSVFVHRLDSEYARFLLQGSKGKKAAATTPNLKTGHTYLQDSEGELDYLLIPYYGSNKEAVIEAASMLLQLTGPTEPQLLDTVTSSVHSKAPINTPVNADHNTVYTDQTIVYQGPTPKELEEAPTLVTSQAVTIPTIGGVINGLDVALAVTIIKRMRKQQIAHYKIAASIGLNGRYYPQYQELCTANGISLEDGKFTE